MMGSTSYIGKPKSMTYRGKSGSSVGSDKEMNGKLRRPKIRRPSKMNEYGLKRIPDYTELAYKEAVSKLRYFLSGNYVPSVRSYAGSASIKNLDESDDAEKKSTYNYALTEYRPRPRLTAKYATLYADSLNNTQDSKKEDNSVFGRYVVPPAPAADTSSGTNPDVVNFIQKQEEYIEQLERESQYCRDELNNLLGKVKEVISENENLHEAQKNKLISRMFYNNPGSETDELDDVGDSTGLDSDNKGTPSKPRKFGKSRSIRLEGPNIVFESRIAELEAQLAQSKIDLKKVQEENNENKRKLAAGIVDSTCLDGFKRQIDNLQRDKTSLESQISKLRLNLEQKDGDFDGKYKRSDSIEQQLRDERNNLEAEIRRLKDELTKERTKVRELSTEGSRRALQERNSAELRYAAHCDALQRDLATRADHSARLQLDLERQRREENELKRDLSMKTATIEALKNELKTKTASLQADLAQAQAEKASVEEELASARLAIERQQRQAKHETNRLNSEIQSLRQRLDRADADLVHSRRENLRLTEQIATLEKELNMKTLTPSTPEKKKDKELSTMLESMENKHAKTVAELETMIQSQNSLMEKLTGECRSLTDKLDDVNRRHKDELATLQRQVEHLGRSLQPTTAPSTYKAPTPHPPAANGSVGLPESVPGPRFTGADPTSLTGDDRGHRDQPNLRPGLSKQSSRSSIKADFDTNKDTTQIEEVKEPVYEEKVEQPMEVEQEYTDNYGYDQTQDQAQYDNDPTTEYQNEIENTQYPIANDDSQYQPQNSDGVQYQTEPPDETPYPNVDNTQYQNEYDPNYQQPAYTEGQYENYEQYPQQQYTDPNQQYEGQYNYGTDGNYQEQNYDNSQLTQSSQEYTPQYEETKVEEEKEKVIPAPVESKRSNSPNEKIASQS